MLGVSHAATVGLNFQANYCGSPSYAGAVVTAPAFGVDTNKWESLPLMDTGYGNCPDSAAYLTLNQVLNQSSSGDGLHPLPNGSLNVTWSAYTANVSGFGGYSRSGPNYTYGGNGHKPGNEEVYWGFLRDGVNFGPGSSGGDNNQPGYAIDITGLKSVFTNAFAVQLIASADSMQYLTNSFVIDVSASSTQSVVYPSTPPVHDVGDTPWVRGIGGGLSTASGALNTDHLKIIGNRAAHAGDKETGANFASTIAGLILTDQPVISMSPQPVLVLAGDTVTWGAYAVGVPPLSYQWRRNGTPIAGATSSSFSLTNVSSADNATYDLVVTNQFGSAVSSPVSIDHLAVSLVHNLVLDTNPNGPERDGLNFGASWLASSGSRSNVMSFQATNLSQIVVPGQTNFDSPVGTITFWMRSAGPLKADGTPAMLWDRRTGDGLVIAQTTNGTIQVQTSAGANDLTSTSSTLNDNNWHHVAVTFDQSDGGPITLYIDGVTDTQQANSKAWSWAAGQQIEIGRSHDSFWQAYNGLLGDVRFYNRVLTEAEVAQIKNTGATVDANALVMRLNFDTAPSSGLLMTWGFQGAVLQSADSASGPYQPMPAAVSPYVTSLKAARMFYRYTGTHTPTNIIANPYLM
jgi:hypothetical protein